MQTLVKNKEFSTIDFHELEDASKTLSVFLLGDGGCSAKEYKLCLKQQTAT